MIETLLKTNRSGISTVLRWTLAIVMFPHGAQKVFGWFGGYGFSGTMEYFTGTLGIPALLTVLVLVAEFLGPIALAAGFLTRAASAGIAAVMIGAIFSGHAANGFFMNWTGAQAGEGIEYHLLVIGMSVALILAGGGRFSIDCKLMPAES
jgi:putative oxidoreductase